ncbi:unnamed protein product [Parnassius mnemosyne]|uniref:FP protein C-terminal domain-containing protein n=1 Tax=Parnassius mnemosyne TaxID=213953 RepID=A0AAV1LLD4_9NEOP
MFKCTRCDRDFRDGVKCSVCQERFDFPCAGLTEAGYRRLGEDRRNNWRCTSCKDAKAPSPLNLPSKNTLSKNTPSVKSLSLVDMEMIASELKSLSSQTNSLPTLIASVKAIQADVADLKSIKADIEDLKLMKPEVADMRTSLEFVQCSVESLNSKITEINQEIQSLLKTKDDVVKLKQRLENFEDSMREFEQRSRMNNIEIKGVPMSPSENLFEIFSKLGDHINCVIPKNQINYIARIPMRNDKLNKTIIISVHNRYLKEDFVAAAKKRTIVPADLGLRGDNRIFFNDHLTLENKMLLNKAKKLAKERGFAYVWVKGCKIFARKNPTSHIITIKSEYDLKKFS